MGRIMLPEVIENLSKILNLSNAQGSIHELNPPGVFFEPEILASLNADKQTEEQAKQNVETTGEDEKIS